MQKKEQIEIECKYLIERPDEATLASLPGLCRTEIEQRYLTADKGLSERVRICRRDGRVTYFHTVKEHLTPLARAEKEEVIDRAAYLALCERTEPDAAPIRKTRYTFPFGGRVFELDVYRDFSFSTLECEVADEAELREIVPPPFVRVLRDVTEDRAYSNHALAQRLAAEKKAKKQKKK